MSTDQPVTDTNSITFSTSAPKLDVGFWGEGIDAINIDNAVQMANARITVHDGKITGSIVFDKGQKPDVSLSQKVRKPINASQNGKYYVDTDFLTLNFDKSKTIDPNVTINITYNRGKGVQTPQGVKAMGNEYMNEVIIDYQEKTVAQQYWWAILIGALVLVFGILFTIRKRFMK